MHPVPGPEIYPGDDSQDMTSLIYKMARGTSHSLILHLDHILVYLLLIFFEIVCFSNGTHTIVVQ
jgi:hypothetical protein